MLLPGSLLHLMQVEVTSACVPGNTERVGLLWITRCVSPFLYTLTGGTFKQHSAQISSRLLTKLSSPIGWDVKENLVVLTNQDLSAMLLQTSLRRIDFHYCFCTTIPKLVNCLPAEMCGDSFHWSWGGVLSICRTTISNSYY